MIKFDDVKNQTTEEYFNGNQFSIDAFNKKYILYPEETYVQALKRVCDSVASVEKTDELKKYWSEKWFDEIYNDWWHPAGSIMQGAGSDKKISLANCTTISMGVLDDAREWDNLESIIKNTGYTLAKTAAYRQGLGIDGSRLRPRGSEILNSAVESTGVVHWLQWLDSMARFVGQKGRIPAILLSLNIKHPDIEEFITVKSDYTKIQNANISVQITNDFYKTVENNEDWELYFKIPAIKKGQPILLDVHSIDADCRMNDAGQWYKVATHNKKEQVIKKTVKAKKILELIAQNMTNNAEPGIQNIDIAREYSNSDAVYDPHDHYDSRILSTNACSEQYLSRESLCVLSSINMERFSIDSVEYAEELSKIGESINRFLDNVNTYELEHQTYATPHQRLAIEKLRRTGAGITNIGGWLFKQYLEYGSKSANLKVDHFLEMYNYALYKSTIALGKEKGNFGLFNKEKILKSGFIKQLQKHLKSRGYEELEFDTMRNVTVSSIAPTGTLSLMFRNMVMSYGIEPAFGLYYWKRTRMSGKYEYYFIVPGVVRHAFKVMGIDLGMKSDAIKDTWDGKIGTKVVKIIDENKDIFKFKNATEIDPLDKLDLMSRAMKSVDSSISVTYMLPENADWKDTYKFILKAYETGVKSIAAFPDRKMYGIISYIPFKDLAFKLQKEKIAIHSSNFDNEELEELNLSKEYIHASSAPKRPIKLSADVYSINVKGEKFIVAIGLLNGAPYEIFCGKMNGLNFKFSYKEGIIEKVKKGQYKLVIGEDIEIEDFSGYFKPVEAELFRMVSTSLRHGVPIKFIVEQLSKSADDMSSLTSAASRVLKKYIKAGEIATGILCPQCGAEVIYNITGCTSCTSCTWEKCN